MNCSTKLLFQISVEALVILLFCTWGMNVLKSWYSGDTENNEVHNPAWNSQVIYAEPERETKYPIVLWWIPFSRTPRLIKKCGIGTCLFTHSRTEINNSLTKSVIFYGRGLQWNDLPLPRNPYQTWSILHEKSPQDAWKLTLPEVISLFNYTATCSRFSTFPLVTLWLNSLQSLLAPMRTPSHMKSISGYGLAMYLHNDCECMSDSDSYVSELMKYIPIDSYGSCLHNSDLPDNIHPGESRITKEVIDLMSKYKFVLTFEDAICEDYITDKLWSIFEAGSVPVYKGSPSVNDWAPNDHSVINIDEFTSPAQLGHYLLLLHNDSVEYNSFFEYKKEGITNKRLLEHMNRRAWTPARESKDPNNTLPNFIEAFECQVCDDIHKRESELRKGKPVKLVKADLSHYRCPSVKPSLQITSSSELINYQGRDRMRSWKQHTMCEEIKARGASERIKTGIFTGKEVMEETLEKLSKECELANREYETDDTWMVNQHDNDKIVHTPVSIGMCKDLD